MNEEIWKDTEYKNYEISNKGNLRNKTTKQIRKWSIANGYYHCVISLGARNNYATVYAHRLVATAFIPNLKNLPQVNHKDGNKLHNEDTNLEWVTEKENQIYAIKTGLTKKGEKCSWSKLTQEQVDYIKAHPEITNAEFSRKYKVHHTTISKIRNNHSWN